MHDRHCLSWWLDISENGSCLCRDFCMSSCEYITKRNQVEPIQIFISAIIINKYQFYNRLILHLFYIILRLKIFSSHKHELILTNISIRIVTKRNLLAQPFWNPALNVLKFYVHKQTIQPIFHDKNRLFDVQETKNF